MARFYNRNPDRAANLFMRVLREHGENVSVLAELAEALDDAGRNLEGRSAWTRVSAAAGEGGDVALRDKAAARLALADKAVAESEQRQLMEAGLQALYETNRPSVAIGFFREVLKRNSSHYGATYQLAVALEKVGQAEETRTLWARVLEMAEGYRDSKTAAEAKARLDKLAKAESR